MYHTLSNLDTIVPQITSSLASFLTDLSNYGIPNTFGLLVESVLNVSDSIFEYVNKTADSFILPTILLQDKMVSDDENDMGVFSIYNRRIQPAANRFYERARMYPKLKDISKYFARQDWTEYTEEMQDLLDEEKDLVSNMTFLNTFFDYLNVTIFPFKEFTENLTNNVVEGTNKTVGELINDLQEKNLSSFQYLDDVYQNVDYYEPAYRWTLVGFLIFGIVLIGAIIFLSIMFWMHSKCSICVASTISIYPLIATLLMFVFAFIFTGIGYADVSISNQFEDALDEFLMDVINVTIPQREIVFPQINITFYTQETYVGVLNISSIVFPEQMNNLKKFFLSNKNDGFAESLNLEQIADMDRYGDEIGNFIIDLGQHFTFPSILDELFHGVAELFSLVSYFPRECDGFFNWGIPMKDTTSQLRKEISQMDPSALPDLEPYLTEIDGYVNEMNSQYDMALSLIYINLSNAIDHLDLKVANYIKSVMYDLGTDVRHTFKQVYHVLNNIKIEPVIGPYAVVRNFFFYDVADTCTYLSASGTLMMFGFVFVVILMMIRRKGMLSENDIQLRRNESNKLDDEEDIECTNPDVLKSNII